MINHSYEYERANNDEKRLLLAEERTALSYVRTFITILGFLLILLKVYFEQGGWFGVVISFIITLISVILIEEAMRFKHLIRKKRKLDIRIKGK